MKSRTGVVAACLLAAAVMAQEQSPFQPPAVAVPAAVVSPLVLNLAGVTVTDQSGQPLGPIQHILLNPSGCVDLAVVSFGGQRLVPIPWRLVSGVGATRGETEVAGQVALSVKLDRQQLQQAPSFTANQLAQLSQQQTIQQVNAFFGVQEQGGTGSQTNVVGGSVNVTNRIGIGITNQTGIPSPTGPTNAIPGRPAFETNRPGQPSINPGAPPANRLPVTRPPTNRLPVGAPAAQPGQPQ